MRSNTVTASAWYRLVPPARPRFPPSPGGGPETRRGGPNPSQGLAFAAPAGYYSRMAVKPPRNPQKVPAGQDNQRLTSIEAREPRVVEVPPVALTQSNGNRGGRPRKATGRDLLVEICARVATGETLTAIAKESGMPSPPRFRAEVAKDRELSDLWREAKAERPHALFDEALDLARELRERAWGKDEGNTVRAKQIAIDALRVAAGRLNPREYGERPATNVVVPVQINTTLGLEPGKTPPAQRKEYTYSVAPPAEEPFNGP
jgi:hypothetical protein